MNLTPEFICNQPKYPSIRISLLMPNYDLVINGSSSDKYILGTSILSLVGSNYLLIDNIPSPTLKSEPNIEQITSCLLFAEKAFYAAKLHDWEAFGINLDKGYCKERELLKTNLKSDIAYATARTLGAYGGYPNDNKLFLVCPPNDNDKIEEGVLDAIRNIG